MIKEFLVQKSSTSTGLKNFMHQEEMIMYYWMI